MSKINELGNSKSPDIKERFKNLATILGTYLSELDKADADLKLEGKSLEKANRENASLQYYYHSRLIELNTLTKYMEHEVVRIRGKLFCGLAATKSNLDLSDRAKDKYIDCDQVFLDINEIYLEVKEVRDRYESVVEAFRSRGYSLNNITKVRVSQIEDMLIT